jgi:4-amino-4-deoxychorismate lyase
MRQLIETIKIKNRTVHNIEYHNRRFNKTREELFGITDYIELNEIIAIPDDLSDAAHKARIIYSKEIESIEFIPYKPKQISTLQIVEAPQIDYSYKYKCREIFDQLLKSAVSDEIIIAQNGYITDTSFSNLVFFDGTKWISPSTYLLDGTMRSSLIDSGEVSCEEIRISDLKLFKGTKLINAMLNLSGSPLIKMDSII